MLKEAAEYIRLDGVHEAVLLDIFALAAIPHCVKMWERSYTGAKEFESWVAQHSYTLALELMKARKLALEEMRNA